MPAKRPRKDVEPTIFPCDSCRASKIKCDHQKPCSNCSLRDKQCTYTSKGEGRQRTYHKRSRHGCAKCKTRRVRCDEGKPACGGCVKMGLSDECSYLDCETGSRSRSPSFDINHFLSGVDAQPVSIPTVTSPTQRFPIPLPSALPSAHPLFSDAVVPVSARPQQSTSTFAAPLPSFQTNMSLHQRRSGRNPPAYASFPGTLSTMATSSIPISAQIQTIDSCPPSPTIAAVRSGLESQTITSPESSDIFHIHMSLREKHQLYQQQVVSQDSAMAYMNTGLLLPEAWLVAPLHQPDVLSIYFPTMEQRQQYRHFFSETIKSLVVLPTPPSTNPWLCRMAAMVLGPAYGQDPAYDALRSAILSLASLDIGFRIHHSLANRNENAMYATSWQQRNTAIELMRLCEATGAWGLTADLLIAATLALSFRDRLAGSHEWEQPLKIGTDIICDAGGPAAFIATSPTPSRRYLVEQMACVEIIALLTVFGKPRITAWDRSWLDVDPIYEPNDHLHVVYGWSRDVVKIGADAVIIGDEHRSLELLRSRNRKTPYITVKEHITARIVNLEAKCQRMLSDSQTSRTELVMTPLPAEVTLVSLGFQTCMEILVHLIVSGSANFQTEQGQRSVEITLEIVDEAFSRGIYTGMLMPLSWAAGCALGENYDKAIRLLCMLRDKYHLEHDLLHRLIHFDWREFEGIEFDAWEVFLKARGMYVPIF